ncbi:MAG: carboxypeptidase regulatory-like domain-containing protein [Gemmatimonadota bacterium]
MLVVLATAAAAPGAAQAQQEDLDLPEAECRVYGRILEAGTGTPVSGASVWLERAGGVGEGLEAARTTGEDGAFLFDFLECRPFLIRAEMIGYDDAEESIGFEGGAGAYEVTIRLARAPIELEELTVEVLRSTRLNVVGFYARKAWVESTGEDLADFYDPVEITGRSAAIHTVAGLAHRSRIKFLYPMGVGCRRPSFYIDGRRFRRWRNFNMFLDMRVRTQDVEGMEIYRPLSTAIPAAFRDEDSTACGAVLIWTKGGRGLGEVP